MYWQQSLVRVPSPRVVLIEHKYCYCWTVIIVRFSNYLIKYNGRIRELKFVNSIICKIALREFLSLDFEVNRSSSTNEIEREGEKVCILRIVKGIVGGGCKLFRRFLKSRYFTVYFQEFCFAFKCK